MVNPDPYEERPRERFTAAFVQNSGGIFSGQLNNNQTNKNS